MSRTARQLLVYGILILSVGLAGWALRPETAVSGAIVGGVVFLIVLALSFPVRQGHRGAAKGAVVFVAAFGLLSTFLAAKRWMLVADGEPKELVASLISAMALLSFLFAWTLWRAFKHDDGAPTL